MTYEWYTAGNSTNSWYSPSTTGIHPDWYWKSSYYKDGWKPSQIPAIVRYPKKPKPKWRPFIEKKKRIPNISIDAVRIEVRPVMICGWCGARIKRGEEEEVCPYCGS